ncbi:hypothetical protein B0H11DRAFT_1718415 [Mycena galericulata]|nr:hypothetical protein B0H11DRAFT_1718415 [Mycena galericulata]
MSRDVRRAAAAVFADGTAGVGHATPEALARYTSGRIHVILNGQNDATATRILADLNKRPGGDACKREFVRCDASEVRDVRKTCAELRERLEARAHKLSGSQCWARLPPVAQVTCCILKNSFTVLTILSLCCRYYSRFVYIQELVSLLTAAADLGQDVRAMTILGADLGFPIITKEINNSQARGSAHECLKGITAVRRMSHIYSTSRRTLSTVTEYSCYTLHEK